MVHYNKKNSQSETRFRSVWGDPDARVVLPPFDFAQDVFQLALVQQCAQMREITALKCELVLDHKFVSNAKTYICMNMGV